MSAINIKEVAIIVIILSDGDDEWCKDGSVRNQRLQWEYFCFSFSFFFPSFFFPKKQSLKPCRHLNAIEEEKWEFHVFVDDDETVGFGPTQCLSARNSYSARAIS